MADCTQLCPGAAQQPGSPSSSSTAVVDVELLARESPGLVLAQESNHSCLADAQHIAEVAPCMSLRACSPTKEIYNTGTLNVSRPVGVCRQLLQTACVHLYLLSTACH